MNQGGGSSDNFPEFNEDVDTVEAEHRRALEDHEKARRADLMAADLDNLGNVQVARGDLAKAHDFLTRAWLLYRQAGDADAMEGMRRKTELLLAKARELADRHPDDPGLRRQLAEVLVKSGVHPFTDDDAARTGAIWQELYELAKGHLDDSTLRRLFAWVLSRMLGHAADQGDIPRRQVLLVLQR
jgi:hypothetical protein